jgi:multisubunit Na+/H+ antiporter MnhC subunit
MHFVLMGFALRQDLVMTPIAVVMFAINALVVAVALEVDVQNQDVSAKNGKLDADVSISKN